MPPIKPSDLLRAPDPVRAAVQHLDSEIARLESIRRELQPLQRDRRTHARKRKGKP